MCKRFIAIPLLCLVVIMAACPFSVYASSVSSTFPYPVNQLSGDVGIEFYSKNATGLLFNSCDLIPFGTLWTGKFLTLTDEEDPSGNHSSMGYSLLIYCNFTLNVTVGGDLYIALPYHTDSSYLSGGLLSAYRYPNGDYNVDFGDDWPVTTYTPDPSTDSFIEGEGTGSLYVRFICFKNVPVGEYNLEVEFADSSVPICFGVYADTRTSMNALVDDYVNSILNADIDYPDSDALSSILSELRELSLSQSSDNVDLSILRQLEYQSSVMYLYDQLSTLFAGVFPSLFDSFDELFNAYSIGEIGIGDVFKAFSEFTSVILSVCHSEEQTAAASSFIDCQYSRFEFIARVKAEWNMDSAISDDDVYIFDNYYQSEAELIQAFDQAKFQKQLDFDTWFSLLPPDETIEYKKIFDYILNDSPIKNYIMIPVTMGLVTILLGTGIRFVGSKRGENSD